MGRSGIAAHIYLLHFSTFSTCQLHTHLGELVGKVEVDGCRLIVPVACGFQQVGQSIVLVGKVQFFIQGIPRRDGGGLLVLPIEGSFGSPCRAIVGIGSGFTIKADTNGIACFELAAHPVYRVFADPRPRLFAHLRRECDATYLQRVFAFGQRRAVLSRFVLRTGGEQQCRHEAIH